MASPYISPSRHSFERERNSLPAADTERDDSTFQGIALHRMQQPRRQNGAGGPNGMAVRNGSALHVHYIFGEAKA
jgi:hypothetical protein